MVVSDPFMGLSLYNYIDNLLYPNKWNLSNLFLQYRNTIKFNPELRLHGHPMFLGNKSLLKPKNITSIP